MQEGIRERQKLLAISSPMQSGEMWPLNDKPSLRFVREAIGKLRRTPSVDLEFSREPVPLEAEREPAQAPMLQSSLMQNVEGENHHALSCDCIGLLQSPEWQDRMTSNRAQMLSSTLAIIDDILSIGCTQGAGRSIAKSS